MKKILIVDDEPNIVMSLEYTFKKNNYEVFIARDGQEALDILKHRHNPITYGAIGIMAATALFGGEK